MGDRYGRSDINEISIGMSICANEMGDESIDTVIFHIDMGHVFILHAYTLRGRRPSTLRNWRFQW